MQTSETLLKKQENLQFSSNKARQRYRHKGSDTTSMRYQCFCSRQYFNYSAMWQHLKKCHIEFLRENKNYSSTHIIQIKDPQHGFKIKKLLKQQIFFGSVKRQEINQIQKQDIVNLKKRQIQQKINNNNDDTLNFLQIKANKACLQISQKNKQLSFYQKKLQNNKQMIQNLQNIVSTYQDIFRILKIQPITNRLSTLSAKKHIQRKNHNSTDEDYKPC